MGDILNVALKSKYIKRTGGSGHYVYTYKLPSKKPKSKYAKEVVSIVDDMPEEYQKYLSGKVFSSDDNVAAMVNTDTGDIFTGKKWKTANQSDKVDLVYHELAHVVTKKKIKNLSKKTGDLFTEGFKTETRFDEDPFEDFMDTIAAYMQPRYREHLKKNAPKKSRPSHSL